MKKAFILAAALLLLFSPLKSQASDTFIIYFYYNAETKALSFDKLATKNIVHDTVKDISLVEFAKNQTSGEFILKLYETDGKEILSTEFNKKVGTFSIDIPYFSLATGLKVFQKSTNKEILSADLSEFSTCNGNGVCEYEKGETTQNCMGDCATSKPTFSPETQKMLSDNNNVIKNSNGDVLIQSFLASGVESAATAAAQPATSSNKSYLYIALAGIVLLLSVGFIVYIKFMKK